MNNITKTMIFLQYRIIIVKVIITLEAFIMSIILCCIMLLLYCYSIF